MVSGLADAPCAVLPPHSHCLHGALFQEVAGLTDVVMRLGMGWPMTLLDVTFRKWVLPKRQ